MASWIWRDIQSSFVGQDEFGVAFQECCRLQLGDGNKLFFWSDHWIGSEPLQSRYPRIFALAWNKNGKVKEFGLKVNDSWSWNICLRRRLFDWEISQWDSLLRELSDIKTNGFSHDCLVWRGNCEGIYSAKSGYLCTNKRTKIPFDWKGLVWSGLVPPRIDFFIWQAALGRLAVRSELAKRGIGDLSNILCPFCSVKEESVPHLFLYCYSTWEIWSWFFRVWNLFWVLPCDISSLLMQWGDLKPPSVPPLLWKLIPIAIFWSTWLFRNEVVFKNTTFDKLQLLFLVRFRLASWYKAGVSDVAVSLEDVIANPAIVGCGPLKQIPTVGARWLPPPVGFVKINTDGAVLASGSRGGIGGIAHSHSGEKILEFSKSVGAGPPVLAELLAIREGIALASSNVICAKARLIIETDCCLAVDWIENPAECPLIFRNLVQEIIRASSPRGCIFRKIPRCCNSAADVLAKRGIG
ncbi:hypothetical protein like AT3G09510 [Hibiscus trionum]|uniref:Reverse transcriptase zinc-binding domain-containing protein n=1 Tax=Hibiscus trionum TaxID=183268 RepID=A0A9W7H9S6_HIBTR|nr:hypothetical protein like AT3G09510 [Hibiscus trionum]